MTKKKQKIIISPLKIQGKKTKLISDIMLNAKEILSQNPNIDTWIEPFAGSGEVALNVPEQIKNVFFADINPHVINFFKAIQNNTINETTIREYFNNANEQLNKNNGETSYSYYRQIRDKFNNDKENANPLDFLFLSKTGFNGLMRFNKKGEFNAPFCQNKNKFNLKYIDSMVNEVNQIKEKFNNTNYYFYCCTSKELLDNPMLKALTNNTIIYCDPPYYGLSTDYFNSWNEEDESILRSQLINLSDNGSKFILSTWMDNGKITNPMIEKYWTNYRLTTIEHRYIVGAKSENRKKIKELLIDNYTPF